MTDPLLDDDNNVWLSYREAAALVHRSRRTIRYWRQRGMPMGWAIVDGQRIRVVRKKVLQKWFRERLVNWPTHQYRMRRDLRDSAEVRGTMVEAHDAPQPEEDA